ncbi:hypothetical protein HMY34_18885 [Thiothrix subterranea]|uniref:hypothetical protein n=1 Tax=Thiothrix subterranea TaxID=2735563 RepID=UPI00192AC489|nr:hypothetical protein [Thiothrix subterranea]QQZ30650.1 hypothetical protein HMY34_18885 [Thiothrix subterranea]
MNKKFLFNIVLFSIGLIGGTYYLFYDDFLERKQIFSYQKSLVEIFKIEPNKSAIIEVNSEGNTVVNEMLKENTSNKQLFVEIDELLSKSYLDLSMLDSNVISKCSICLDKLSGVFLSSQLSSDEIIKFATALSKGNHPEIAEMLVNTLHQIIVQEGYSERSDVILSVLANFDSPQSASVFADYLVKSSLAGEGAVDTVVGKTLRKIVLGTTDSHQVGIDLAQKFFDSTDMQQRERILAIGHPESLVQIGLTAVEQGDILSFQMVAESFRDTSGVQMPDALLALYRKQGIDSYQLSETFKLAGEWATQHAEGKTLDFVESQLVNGDLSEGEEQLIINMIKNSPDPRGKVILSKYQQQ